MPWHTRPSVRREVEARQRPRASAPEPTLEFASQPARQMAHGAPGIVEALAARRPSSARGYTVADVRRAARDTIHPEE